MTARMRPFRPPELYRDELEGLAFHYHLAVLDTREDVGAFARDHLLRSVFAPFSRSLFTTVAARLASSVAALALVIERARVDRAVDMLHAAGVTCCVGWSTPETLARCRPDLRASFQVMGYDEAVAASVSRQASLVDVRSETEAAANPMESWPMDGSRNVPLDRFLVRRSSPSGRAGLPWVFYSPGGARAAVATSWQLRDGHRAVWLQDRQWTHQLPQRDSVSVLAAGNG